MVGKFGVFTALNTSTGEVLGACVERYRHQEWLALMKTINRQTPMPDLATNEDRPCIANLIGAFWRPGMVFVIRIVLATAE